MQTTRTWLLTLGLLASTLVGCASSLVREDDTLSGYRLELARLVDTGVLTKDDAEKFYGIASLEMERRAALRSEPLSNQPSDPNMLPTRFVPFPKKASEL
jgi:hypothetical protein